jgi:hypothetical protein
MMAVVAPAQYRAPFLGCCWQGYMLCFYRGSLIVYGEVCELLSKVVLAGCWVVLLLYYAFFGYFIWFG